MGDKLKDGAFQARNAPYRAERIACSHRLSLLPSTGSDNWKTLIYRGPISWEHVKTSQRRATGLFFDTVEIINDIRPLAIAYLNQMNELNIPPNKQLFEFVEPIIGAKHRPLDFGRDNLLILTEFENSEFLNELLKLRRLQNELVEFAEDYGTSRKILLSKMASIKPPLTTDGEIARMSFTRDEIAHLDPEIAMLSSLTAHLMNIADEANNLAVDVAKRIGPLLRSMFKKGVMKIKLDIEESP